MHDYTVLEYEEQATQLVNDHIYANQTYLINTILQIDRTISWADIVNLFDQENNPQYILEWWSVSPWLAKQLQKEGEPILETDFGYWWGRTTSGQAIKFDHVIRYVSSS